MDIDKPLDEMIKTTKASRGRRGGRGPRPAAAPATGGARARYSGAAPKGAAGVAAAAAPKPAAIGAEASKIIISNLPQDVNEAAIRDLMQSTVGPVKSVQLNYTSTGKSTGVATVLFRNKGDGNKAHKTYHNRMIDNQRPMKVELAFDPSQLVSLASRVAPAPAAAANTRAAAPRRGRGSGRPRSARPQKKSAEELDAEMSAYKETGTAA